MSGSAGSSFRADKARDGPARRWTVAINGKCAFFQMSSNGANVYSRNGVFNLAAKRHDRQRGRPDADGYAAMRRRDQQFVRPCRSSCRTRTCQPSATKNVSFAFKPGIRRLPFRPDAIRLPPTRTPITPLARSTSTDSLAWHACGQNGRVFVKQSHGLWGSVCDDRQPPTHPSRERRLA